MAFLRWLPRSPEPPPVTTSPLSSPGETRGALPWPSRPSRPSGSLSIRGWPSWSPRSASGYRLFLTGLLYQEPGGRLRRAAAVAGCDGDLVAYDTGEMVEQVMELLAMS